MLALCGKGPSASYTCVMLGGARAEGPHLALICELFRLLRRFWRDGRVV